MRAMLNFTWSESCRAERRSRTLCLNSRIQDQFPVSLQRSEPDVFDRQRILFSNIEFAAALGLSDFDPVGGLIASAAETRDLTESLEQYRADGVTLLPVLGQTSLAAGQDMRGQIGNADPRQNQKASIVRHKMQVALPNFGRPADEAVARRGLPGGRAESEQRQRLPADAADEVSNLRPGQRTVAEIMIAFHERIPDRRARSGLDHLELQRLNFRQGRGQLEPGWRPIGLRQVGAGPTPKIGHTGAVGRRRQFDQAMAMHPQQRHPRALMSLRPPSGLRQSKCSHTAREIALRVQPASRRAATRAIQRISSALKSRPQ